MLFEERKSSRRVHCNTKFQLRFPPRTVEHASSGCDRLHFSDHFQKVRIGRSFVKDIRHFAYSREREKCWAAMVSGHGPTVRRTNGISPTVHRDAKACGRSTVQQALQVRFNIFLLVWSLIYYYWWSVIVAFLAFSNRLPISFKLDMEERGGFNFE
jgi:hypothetical protein